MHFLIHVTSIAIMVSSVKAGLPGIGENWTGLGEESKFSSITWNQSGEHFVAVSSHIYLSSNGHNWVRVPYNKYKGGHAIESSHTGIHFVGDRHHASSTNGGKTWNADYFSPYQNSGSSNVLNGIYPHGDHWVTAADTYSGGHVEFFGSGAPADVLDTVYPMLGCTSNGTTAVAVGGTSYFQGASLGGSTAVWTSASGWAENYLGYSTHPLYDVKWNGSHFVAVGGGGHEGLANGASIQISTDGITWTAQSPGTATSKLTGLAWNGSEWVAVGLKGTILSSTNSTAWTQHASGTNDRFNDVAFNGSTNEILVAATGSYPLYASSDKTTWTGRKVGKPLPEAEFTGLAWSGSKLVSVDSAGKISTSADGENWTTRSSGTSQDLQAISSHNGKMVVVGANGTLLTSSDGISWLSQTSGVSNNLQAISLDGPLAVVIGSGGCILTSEDCVQWTSRNSTITTDLHDIAWNGTLYLAVGSSGRRLISYDGIAWVASYFQENGSNSSKDITGVSWMNDAYVAVSKWDFWKSSDGLTWDPIKPFASASLDPQFWSEIEKLIWTGETLIAYGNGAYLSTDGENWSKVWGLPTDSLYPYRSACWTGSHLFLGGYSDNRASSYLYVSFIPRGLDYCFWAANQNLRLLDALPNEDPNDDGVPNLIAHALNIPASQPSTASDLASLPEPLSSSTRGITFKLSRQYADNLIYTVECSPTMQENSWVEIARREYGNTWSGSASVTETEYDVNRNDVKINTSEAINTASPTFYRLKVSE